MEPFTDKLEYSDESARNKALGLDMTTSAAPASLVAIGGSLIQNAGNGIINAATDAIKNKLNKVNLKNEENPKNLKDEFSEIEKVVEKRNTDMSKLPMYVGVGVGLVFVFFAIKMVNRKKD